MLQLALLAPACLIIKKRILDCETESCKPHGENPLTHYSDTRGSTTRDDGNEDRGLSSPPPTFPTTTHLFWERTSWLTKHRPYLTPPNPNPTGLRDFITDFILARVDMATTENCLIFISL